MRRTLSLVAALVVSTVAASLFAGDSGYGVVQEVRSANVVLLAAGKARYVIRLVGVDPPKEGPLAVRAKEFVSQMVLGKHARFYLYQKINGEFVAGLNQGDPDSGFKDVGLELVRNGLARAVPNHFYKYGDLEAAEKEARERGLGIWAAHP